MATRVSGLVVQLDRDGSRYREPVCPADFSLSSSKVQGKFQFPCPPTLPSITLQLCQSKEGRWPQKMIPTELDGSIFLDQSLTLVQDIERIYGVSPKPHMSTFNLHQLLSLSHVSEENLCFCYSDDPHDTRALRLQAPDDTRKRR